MKLFLFFLTVLSIFILFSCQQTGFLNKPETSGKAGSEGLAEAAGLDTVISSAEGSNSPIYLFDFSAIKLVPTNSIDIEIKNYALYQDIYGDLLIFGEILNNSGTIKTNLEITFDFSDLSLARIDFKKIPAYTEYLQPGKKIPFCIVYEDRSKYINLGEVKIGANYKNYNQSFTGLPVLADENFFYYDDKMTIEGSLINLGLSDVENIVLIATFYNLRNQVVSIRECYIEKNKLSVKEALDFSVTVLLDEYTPSFTHYKLEVFFRDSLKTRQAKV